MLLRFRTFFYFTFSFYICRTSNRTKCRLTSDSNVKSTFYKTSCPESQFFCLWRIGQKIRRALILRSLILRILVTSVTNTIGFIPFLRLSHFVTFINTPSFFVPLQGPTPVQTFSSTCFLVCFESLYFTFCSSTFPSVLFKLKVEPKSKIHFCQVMRKSLLWESIKNVSCYFIEIWSLWGSLLGWVQSRPEEGGEWDRIDYIEVSEVRGVV